MIHALITQSLTALVEGRVFPVMAPTSTPTPYIVYTQTAGRVTTDLDGTDELKNARIQVEVYADAAEASSDLIDAAAACLDADLDAVPLSTPIDVNKEENAGKFRVSQDFSLWFR